MYICKLSTKNTQTANTMEYRKIGLTDLQLSVVTFGAWAAGGWMWGSTDRQEAITAIRAAFNEGVSAIDTAPIYGQGESESIVGEAIRFFPRDQVQILTKYGMRWDLTKGQFAFHSQTNGGEPIDIYKYAGKESIVYECEQSLRRLKTDYIDLYQIHWPDNSTPIEESMEAVSRLIEQGKVRYAGVCNYDHSQLQEALHSLNIVSNQVPFSAVNRKIEKEIIPFCEQNQRSVLAYSPLERGLLTGKITSGYNFAAGDHRKTHRFFSDDYIQRTTIFLDTLKPLAQSKSASLSQLILRWTIDHPGITIALTGARNAQQAIQNAKAAHIYLAKEDIVFINQQLADAGL